MDEDGVSGADGGAGPVRTKSDERKAARKLRKAEDVAREAPLTVQAQEEREAGKRGGGGSGRNREQRQGGGGGGNAEFTPEELELRRLYAGRIREARAAAGGGKPDESGAVTVSAEEMQLRREYATKLRELRGSATVTVTAPALVASGAASTPESVAVDVGAAPPEQGAIAAPKQRTDAKYLAAIAKRAARAASSQAAPADTLPVNWRPPVPSRMGNVSILAGGEAAPLAAPLLRSGMPSPQVRLAKWLAPRPGARGALTGLTLFLFWQLCRLWSGARPGSIERLGDILISALVAVLAWRLFLRRETHDA